ncbi:MAG: o-succinylbenzoate synthase [Ignavibacteriales bacterium]|nr:o-succinylbenzoate synthase [Ignavibacteriales bacterium]
MRIENIELRHTKMELVSPFETSLGVELHEEHIIVRVDCEGVTGWGECVVEPTPSYSYETLQTAWHILGDFIIPSLLGKDFPDLQSALSQFSWVRGHRMAKAGVEAALADAFAKSQGISLSKYLGGTRKTVPVGVSVGLQATPAELVRVIGGYLQDGYKRIKIKIAPGRDIELVKAVRKEYPDILLQVDANSAYTLDDIAMMKEMDDYNLQLMEQPLGYDDIYDHSLLAREIKTPLCLDESIYNVSDTKCALALGSCKIINIKPGRVGGYTESIRIHDYCASLNVPVWHGGMDESGVGRAGNVALASLPNFSLHGDISATKRYYKKDIMEPEFVLNADGTMTVPDKPGIGVEIDWVELEKVTEKKAVYK